MIGKLKNAVTALAISGLYSIILVILRTPGINSLFGDQTMFKSALIIHVNLSVLVWLLSVTSFIWSLTKIKSEFEPMLVRLSFIGMILMALSPIYPESGPIMNNYVPMLENIIFIIGLVLFGAVIFFSALQTLICSYMSFNLGNYNSRIMCIAQITSAATVIAAWVCFILSYIRLDRLSDIVPLDIDYFYEMLFWSGGHLLQFVYTQILMLILLMLTESLKGGKVIYTNLYEMLLVLNFVLGLFVFVGHYNYGLEDGEFKEYFTRHMIYTGGIAPTIFILMLLIEIFQSRIKHCPSFISASFFSSSFLFLSGGLIGAVISGINVTIPAHYHGSTVGISIALMGLTYLICFKKQVQASLSDESGVISYVYDNIEDLRGPNSSSDDLVGPKHGNNSARNQIYIITLGQLLHITGLALAGGYGVMRKNPGGEIPASAKIYMGMVGGGGLIAIIGGLMFVYICARNLYSFKKRLK